MKAKHYSEVDPKENPHGVDVRPVYSQPDAQLMHMTLKPGQALKPHITPVDVFMYVLEGIATIHIGEDSIDAKQDTCVESPKNIMHWIANNTDKNARILVGKTPSPNKPGRVL